MIALEAIQHPVCSLCLLFHVSTVVLQHMSRVFVQAHMAPVRQQQLSPFRHRIAATIPLSWAFPPKHGQNHIWLKAATYERDWHVGVTQTMPSVTFRSRAAHARYTMPYA